MYGAYETPPTENHFSSVYWNAPKEGTLCTGIVRLLLHFKWTWIGIIVSNDNSGENFLQSLTPFLVQNSICVAFLEKTGIVGMNYWDFYPNVRKITSILAVTDVKVVLVNGNYQSLFTLATALSAN